MVFVFIVKVSALALFVFFFHERQGQNKDDSRISSHVSEPALHFVNVPVEIKEDSQIMS